MPVRTSEAEWQGNLQQGKGTIKLGSGAFEGKYSFSSRFEEEPGTNPEELVGAAHAGCFSMFLAAVLSRQGYIPKRVHTTAQVRLERVGDGFKITRIQLNTEAEVPGIDEQTFQEAAATSKKNCPISQALAATDIEMQAKLVS